MQERYFNLKEKYADFVVLIRCGNFYEVIGEEAYIMNNLFKYKVREFGKTIRAGFPISNLNNIVSKFDELHINYALFDEDEVVKSFNNNKYNNYLEKNTDVVKNTKIKKDKEKNIKKINDKFKITRDIKKTFFFIDGIVSNFPKKDKVLRDRIINDLYSMLEFTYLANSVEDRVLYQKKILAKLKMIDFYIYTAYTKTYINDKQYTQIGAFLINIIKEINGWINCEED